jgi:integrase
MSVTASLLYTLTTVILPGGERRSYLVDKRGLEDDYASLYNISKVRNKSHAVATSDAVLAAINVLYSYCKYWEIDLLARFRAGKYLLPNECEALANYAQRKFTPIAKKRQKVASLGQGRHRHTYGEDTVARNTQRMRLDYIAAYVEWLAKYLLTDSSAERLKKIEAMRDDIVSHKPKAGARRDDTDKKHFTSAQNAHLNEIIMPGSDRNPFQSHVQLRNLCLIEVLRQCGLRRGEELNLRVRDVDHVKHLIKVRRRHDSPDDPRANQPNPKTLERDIPISPYLTELIISYVAERKNISGAKKHQYLFVTHKSGKTQGQPLSIDALNRVFEILCEAEPKLEGLTAHKFRHYFSSELADVQLRMGTDTNSQDAHRRVRNYLSGRKPTSQVDALYTEMDTKRQARKATEALHERMAPPVDLKRRHG